MTILTDSQQIPLTAAFTTKKGNPAKVDGVPAWSSSDPAIVTVVPAEDGLTCLALAVGPEGTAQVSVKADADLGSGVREIVGVIDLEVHPGEAVAAVVTGGAPEEQP